MKATAALRSRFGAARSGVLPVALAALLLMACDRENVAAPAAAAGEAAGRRAEVATAVSDLDRPASELLALSCEHGIPMYTCDECRYEAGVAKAGPELFDPSRGGPLRTTRAAARPIAGGSDLNGEVRLNEEKAVHVSPPAPGVVRAIAVDIGARVSAGQVLFEVESAEYRQAKSDLLRADAALALAEATATRERELFEKRVCPRKDLIEAEASLAQAGADRTSVIGRLLAFGLSREGIEAIADGSSPQSGLMAVRAPFAGTVLERSLSLGAQVQPGDRLLLLADTADVWVITSVYERDVAALLRAQAGGAVDAEVAVAAYPGRIFAGRVERLSGTLDGTTRTASARVVVSNPENLLRAGMFARVRLLLSGAGDRLAVPEEAVLEDAGRSFVFVRAEGPYFIRRPVSAGKVAGGWVEVAGIAAGDEVVVTGAFLLKSDVLRSKMGAGCAD